MATAAAPEPRYFILLRQLVASQETWEAGSLWVVTAAVSDGRELKLARFNPGGGGCGSDDSLQVVCSDVSQLTTVMLSLLVAVRDPQQRLMLFGDATWFREGVELREGINRNDLFRIYIYIYIYIICDYTRGPISLTLLRAPEPNFEYILLLNSDSVYPKTINTMTRQRNSVAGVEIVFSVLVHEPRPENAPTGIIWVGKF